MHVDVCLCWCLGFGDLGLLGFESLGSGLWSGVGGEGVERGDLSGLGWGGVRRGETFEVHTLFSNRNHWS